MPSTFGYSNFCFCIFLIVAPKFMRLRPTSFACNWLYSAIEIKCFVGVTHLCERVHCSRWPAIECTQWPVIRAIRIFCCAVEKRLRPHPMVRHKFLVQELNHFVLHWCGQ